MVYLQSDDRKSNANHLSVGPGAYKIPSLRNVPRDFRVHLFEASTGPASVLGSKATGEPPLFLGSSVFFALREAIVSTGWNLNQGLCTVDSPFTSERIRLLSMPMDEVITGEREPPPHNLNLDKRSSETGEFSEPGLGPKTTGYFGTRWHARV